MKLIIFFSFFIAVCSQGASAAWSTPTSCQRVTSVCEANIWNQLPDANTVLAAALEDLEVARAKGTKQVITQAIKQIRGVMHQLIQKVPDLKSPCGVQALECYNDLLHELVSYI